MLLYQTFFTMQVKMLIQFALFAFLSVPQPGQGVNSKCAIKKNHTNLNTSFTSPATELLLNINSKLDTLTATTAELSQTVQTSISDVECTDSGES